MNNKKQELIEMINQIENPKFIEYIYQLISELMTIWKH